MLPDVTHGVRKTSRVDFLYRAHADLCKESHRRDTRDGDDLKVRSGFAGLVSYLSNFTPRGTFPETENPAKYR